MRESPKITCLQYLNNISRERSGINFFYKLILSLLVDIARYGQSPEITILQHLLHYLKKEVWSEVDLLQVEKHQKY